MTASLQILVGLNKQILTSDKSQTGFDLSLEFDMPLDDDKVTHYFLSWTTRKPTNGGTRAADANEPDKFSDRQT